MMGISKLMTKSIIYKPLGSGENNVSNNETIVGCPSLMARADDFEQHLEKKDSIDQQNELGVFLL